ncbi:hypothetical protein [Priestia filamentosa]|nr:hypothetical protein [Priestia filamentosa]
MEKRIEFKNGSVIEAHDTKESIRGKRSNFIEWKEKENKEVNK